ncbi:MAG: DUF350 domain-containing protein [Deltaproteobacteria bacterium]|nr:DUF350 domain-containing protein [Deltaproteobacteria bacterium]
MIGLMCDEPCINIIVIMESMLPQITYTIAMLFVSMGIFVVAKWANDLFTPYGITVQLVEKDNVALSLSLAGYFASTAIIIIAALLGPSAGLGKDVLIVGGYALLGIVFLNISRVINDRVMLHKFSNIKEIIEDRNAGTGAIECGAYIASGLIVAGAIHGEGGGLTTAFIFFILGQIVLVLFANLYNFLTSFDLHDEIEKDNVASGVAFGGTLIALGIILMNGLCGNFISWQHNLSKFALNAAAAFIILPLVRYFLDKLVLTGSDLNHEIVADRNLGAGLLEMAVTVSFAALLFFLI